MNRSRESGAAGGMAEGSPMPVRRVSPSRHQPWNKGLLVGQKKPLEPKHVWSIRVRLEIAGSKRELAIFNLAIDRKLRACDLVKLRLDDICSGLRVRHVVPVVGLVPRFKAPSNCVRASHILRCAASPAVLCLMRKQGQRNRLRRQSQQLRALHQSELEHDRLGSCSPQWRWLYRQQCHGL